MAIIVKSNARSSSFFREKHAATEQIKFADTRWICPLLTEARLARRRGSPYPFFSPFMHIQDILARNPTTFSFEFFPPKTPEGAESLFQTILELEPYLPHFVSVTYGAGGSTRELTHELVLRLKTQTSLDPIPHLTCCLLYTSPSPRD